MTEPIYRRARHDGDEYDAFSRSARRALCALQRAGHRMALPRVRL